MVGFCRIVGSRAVVMWTHGRTWWRSTATVVLLVICVSRGVTVDAGSYSVDDDRPPTERRQRRAATGRHRLEPSQSGGVVVSNCTSVHQFAVQTMQYSNELPMTKRHGTFTFSETTAPMFCAENANRARTELKSGRKSSERSARLTNVWFLLLVRILITWSAW